MITRIWHGRTNRARADDYAAFLTMCAIPDYREVSHFLTVTRWESEDAIRAFAGDEVLKAKYYPQDEEFLLEFEPEVQHFTVVAAAAAP